MQSVFRCLMSSSLFLTTIVVLFCNASASSACEDTGAQRVISSGSAAATGLTNGLGRTDRIRSSTPLIYKVSARRCVFILATGRSGSTSLMDALNQIPNYLIRGEHWRAIGNLYDAYRRFQDAFIVSRNQGLQYEAHPADPFEEVKRVYALASTDPSRAALFTEFRGDRVLLASRVFYAFLFGYHGREVVSGFKEIRYVCGKYLPGANNGCAEHFNGFISFLTSLCRNVKLIFNSQSSADLDNNLKLFQMDESGRADEDEFLQDLRMTHMLYDDYVRQHSDHSMRVHMEDMFDPKKNTSLAQSLVAFLGEDPATTRIRFTRMPSWGMGAEKPYYNRRPPPASDRR